MLASIMDHHKDDCMFRVTSGTKPRGKGGDFRSMRFLESTMCNINSKKILVGARSILVLRR